VAAPVEDLHEAADEDLAAEIEVDEVVALVEVVEEDLAAAEVGLKV
jgi:hypothetical protein